MLGPFVTNMESTKTLGRRELLSGKAFGIYMKKNDEYISEETRHRRRVSEIVEDIYVKRTKTWRFHLFLHNPYI